MKKRVAIVDYRMGNIFSVQLACERVGLNAFLTNRSEEIFAADAVLLPGVGAFGDAMQTLRDFGLVETLKEVASSGKPFMGICLGMQLLMTTSCEFGKHAGLDILPGEVIRLKEKEKGNGLPLKVPQVGWNQIFPAEGKDFADADFYRGLNPGAYMYFVHSYYVRPESADCVLTETAYGPLRFCSSLRRGNLFACQFHPERSGPDGLKIYQNFAEFVSLKPKVPGVT